MDIDKTLSKLRYLKSWQESENGQSYLLEEAHYINDLLNQHQGNYGCEISPFEGMHYLEKNKVKYALYFSFYEDKNKESAQQGSFQCSPYFWPIKPNHLDVVILHHALDFVHNPTHLLHEATKSIIPGGKLIIVGFNSFSLHNISRFFIHKQRKLCLHLQPLHLMTVKNWLALSGFRVAKVYYGGHLNPFVTKKNKKMGQWLNKFCEKKQFIFGGFYCLLAVNDVFGITLMNNNNRLSKKRYIPTAISVKSIDTL